MELEELRWIVARLVSAYICPDTCFGLPVSDENLRRECSNCRMPHNYRVEGEGEDRSLFGKVTGREVLPLRDGDGC